MPNKSRRSRQRQNKKIRQKQAVGLAALFLRVGSIRTKFIQDRAPEVVEEIVDEVPCCSVCMTELCQGCAAGVCLDNPVDDAWPCPCNETMCNRCLITLILRAPPEDYCQCGCNKLKVECPTCRMQVNIFPVTIQWARDTLQNGAELQV